jgi:lipoprotein-anchoring transpeptidase ErfK/SrfK
MLPRLTRIFLLLLSVGIMAFTGYIELGKPRWLLPASAITQPADGSTNVLPSSPINVSVKNGVVTAVSLAGPDGPVRGLLEKKRFTPAHILAWGSPYELTVSLKNPLGRKFEQHSRFTTLLPPKLNKISMIPDNNSTVGIGQIASLLFDKPVTDKAAVERRLAVSTTNDTKGSWGWVKDSSGKDRVDWRPESYWEPGTKVSVHADLNGVNGGDATYFVRDYANTFTVGQSQIAKVDLPEHRLTLVRNDVPVKSIPVTGGDAAHQTWSGIMPVLAKYSNIHMNSETVGFGNEYNLMVENAMQLTHSGTYAHQAEWTEATIGLLNTSHGCIGLKSEDAAWLYEQMKVGDVFEISGGKETVAIGNGFGDWNLPWASWKKNSAV